MAAKKKTTVKDSPREIESVIRGQRVMLDADLAKLYGVTTRRLNEQVARNRAGSQMILRISLRSKNLRT